MRRARLLPVDAASPHTHGAPALASLHAHCAGTTPSGCSGACSTSRMVGAGAGAHGLFAGCHSLAIPSACLPLLAIPLPACTASPGLAQPACTALTCENEHAQSATSLICAPCYIADDVILLCNRCRQGLKPDGLIFVKENICKWVRRWAVLYGPQRGAGCEKGRAHRVQATGLVYRALAFTPHPPPPPPGSPPAAGPASRWTRRTPASRAPTHTCRSYLRRPTCRWGGGREAVGCGRVLQIVSRAGACARVHRSS